MVTLAVPEEALAIDASLPDLDKYLDWWGMRLLRLWSGNPRDLSPMLSRLKIG